MSSHSSQAVPKSLFVKDPPRDLDESIANIRAFAEELVYDDKKQKITDAKRQGWRLLQRCFPLSFFTLTGSTPPKACLAETPKAKWEIKKAERLEREALTLLTPEQRAKFEEDEAIIRRDKEAQNALRGEVRAAKKRKRDAVEEAKVRLAEKQAKDKREEYERSKRRRVNPPACQGNSVAQVAVPFVTPIGDPVLPGDSLNNLWTAIATGKFAIPGSASDPVTSEVLAVLAKHQNQAQNPLPLASTSQAPTPPASTSQVRKQKATPKRTAENKGKALASKGVNVESLKTPALLSPISPKPTKGKALVRPKTATPGTLSDAEAIKRVEILIRRCDEVDAGDKPVKTPKPRRKSLFNPPSKEIVEAVAKQTARRKSLRSAKEIEVNLADSATKLHSEELPSDKEDELLKEVPATTQVPTPEEQAAATNGLPGKSPRRPRRLSSSSESEPELIVTAEDDEEEALKNAALDSIRDKAVDTLEIAAKKLDLAAEPMTH